jgi:hypothetical protein
MTMTGTLWYARSTAGLRPLASAGDTMSRSHPSPSSRSRSCDCLTTESLASVTTTLRPGKLAASFWMSAVTESRHGSVVLAWLTPSTNVTSGPDGGAGAHETRVTKPIVNNPTRRKPPRRVNLASPRASEAKPATSSPNQPVSEASPTEFWAKEIVDLAKPRKYAEHRTRPRRSQIGEIRALVGSKCFILGPLFDSPTAPRPARGGRRG